MRVISLIPSATELLCLAGGQDLLVGRSHECDWPPGIDHIPALTSQHTPAGAGTTPDDIDRAVRTQLESGSSLYSLDTRLALDLKPDAILTQDLCRVCSIDGQTVRALAARLTPQPLIVSLNPHSLEDVLDDLLTVGRAVGRESQAAAALVALRERFHRAADHVNLYTQGPRVAFLEWTDPLYTAGHWTPQLIERAGAIHTLNPCRRPPLGAVGAASTAAPPSRRVTPDELLASKPDRLIVCPCGIPLSGPPGTMSVESVTRDLAAQPWWQDLPAVRQRQVALVDGNHMFNRPGPRLIDAFEWLTAWLNDRPDLIPPTFPWRTWE